MFRYDGVTLRFNWSMKTIVFYILTQHSPQFSYVVSQLMLAACARAYALSNSIVISVLQQGGLVRSV